MSYLYQSQYFYAIVSNFQVQCYASEFQVKKRFGLKKMQMNAPIDSIVEHFLTFISPQENHKNNS